MKVNALPQVAVYSITQNFYEKVTVEFLCESDCKNFYERVTVEISMRE